MDNSDIGSLILVLFISVTMIAVSSIGMEAYNAHTEYKNKKKNNYTFMIITLSVGVIFTLLTLGFGIYNIVSNPSAKKKI